MTVSGRCPSDGLMRALRASVEMEEISLHLRMALSGSPAGMLRGHAGLIRVPSLPKKGPSLRLRPLASDDSRDSAGNYGKTRFLKRVYHICGEISGFLPGREISVGRLNIKPIYFAGSFTCSVFKWGKPPR
ncbi:hypothetical protein Zmor_025336 [Zophobas morio]|uniref:Uncharacterized protein n=1 Tax=Zophobas morio TaxID=2755281 RepID=A0AA38HRY9_9CUCU|nr:hypothetical protein Zmor_025336 [Zophobas morio]